MAHETQGERGLFRTARDILIVEDEVGISQLMAQILRRMDIGVLVAEDMIEALAYLQETHGRECIAIISDERIPHGSGCQLLHTVRAKYPYLLRVLMTGWTSASVRHAVESRDAEVLLEKPWSDKELFQLVDWMLSTQRQPPRLEA